MAKADLTNYSRVKPLAIQSETAFLYRRSQLLLAYETTKLKPADAPKTWEQLVAWIKANPSQFVYNRPARAVRVTISSAMLFTKPMAATQTPLP